MPDIKVRGGDLGQGRKKGLSKRHLQWPGKNCSQFSFSLSAVTTVQSTITTGEDDPLCCVPCSTRTRTCTHGQLHSKFTGRCLLSFAATSSWQFEFVSKTPTCFGLYSNTTSTCVFYVALYEYRTQERCVSYMYTVLYKPRTVFMWYKGKRISSLSFWQPQQPTNLPPLYALALILQLFFLTASLTPWLYRTSILSLSLAFIVSNLPLKRTLVGPLGWRGPSVHWKC